jgi:hypothetical protein
MLDAVRQDMAASYPQYEGNVIILSRETPNSSVQPTNNDSSTSEDTTTHPANNGNNTANNTSNNNQGISNGDSRTPTEFIRDLEEETPMDFSSWDE